MLTFSLLLQSQQPVPLLHAFRQALQLSPGLGAGNGMELKNLANHWVFPLSPHAPSRGYSKIMGRNNQINQLSQLLSLKLSCLKAELILITSATYAIFLRKN